MRNVVAPDPGRGEHVRLLDAGDSFSFKNHLQYHYANPSEHEDTLVVWANTSITLRK